MRVAILTDFLGGLGGTEALTARMALGLNSRGHDVRVFCPRSPSRCTWIHLLRSSNIPVLLGPPERFFPDDGGARDRPAREQLLDRLAVRLLSLTFANWTPEIILANPMGPLLVAWMRSGRLPTIPVVGYEFSAADSRCAHWYPVELPAVINELDAVLAGCEASRRGVVSYHGFTGHTEVIPPLVPEATVAPLPPEPWKLGCIARLCVEKGLDYLLAALPNIRRRHPKTSLHIYGDGYDRNRLQDLARALSVHDIVTLEGSFDPCAGIDSVARRHAIFVQPSLYESVPTAMLEMAARGRVIVASDVGGIPEFFAAGGQGALVHPGCPQEIADAVNAILDHPARILETGPRNATVIAERYSYRRGLKKLENVLWSVACAGDRTRFSLLGRRSFLRSRDYDLESGGLDG